MLDIVLRSMMHLYRLGHYSALVCSVRDVVRYICNLHHASCSTEGLTVRGAGLWTITVSRCVPNRQDGALTHPEPSNRHIQDEEQRGSAQRRPRREVVDGRPLDAEELPPIHVPGDALAAPAVGPRWR